MRANFQILSPWLWEVLSEKPKMRSIRCSAELFWHRTILPPHHHHHHHNSHHHQHYHHYHLHHFHHHQDQADDLQNFFGSHNTVTPPPTVPYIPTQIHLSLMTNNIRIISYNRFSIDYYTIFMIFNYLMWRWGSFSGTTATTEFRT